MAGGLGLSAALSGLSGVYPAYREGQLEDFKLDDVKRQALARTAMGNALGILAGGGQGMGQPQQPQQSFGPPQGMPPQGGGSQPPMPGQPSSPMLGPGAPGQPPSPPAGAAGPPGPVPGAPGPSMPQAGGPQPPMQQGLPGGRQPMDWRTLVAAVKQANPNLPPDVMAEAVNQFLPMMTAQSQMEWRQISLQMREQALQQRESQFLMAERGRTDRAELASGDRRAAIEGRAQEGQANRVSRETIAKMTVDERREAHEAGLISKEQMDAANRESREKVADKRLTEQSLARTGRERLAERRLEQQQAQFDQRETRLEKSLELRADTTYQRLEQQKQQAAQRAQQAQGKQGLAELRSIIDAQDKHVRTRIMAYAANNNLKPTERKALLDQADMDYNEQIGQLRERFGRSPTGGAPETSTGAPPAGPAKPTLGQFLEKARAANPGVSDADLTAYYKQKYGG